MVKSERPCACVVAIMGSGRSGSTLLEFLLAGCLDGTRALGELETLSSRGVRNEMCSCTRPALDCAAWHHVLTDLAGDSGRVAWESVVENPRRRLRWGLNLWFSALRRRITGRRPPRTSTMDSYASVLRVLSQVARASSGPLIDNSKTPLHFFALAATDQVDLRVVHLVRRPHAVVWSWKRRKHLPESGALNWYMEPKSALVSGGRWLFDQLLAASFRRLHPAHPYVRVSYDELCADPQGTVARCAGALGLQVASEPGRPASYHVLGGNPARFDGFAQVEPDNEWESGLPRRTRIALTMTTSMVYRLLLRRSDRR